MTHKWYVVTTKPRKELVAKQQLENQAFSAYLPMFRRSKRNKGKWQDQHEPLFPGYLFVQLNLSTDNISPIRSTIGVRNLVRFGNQLVAMENDIIDQLMEHERLQFSKVENHATQFSPGDAIKVVDGPIAGLTGVFEMPKSSERVMILIGLLGKQRLVSIDVNKIAPL